MDITEYSILLSSNIAYSPRNLFMTERDFCFAKTSERHGSRMPKRTIDSSIYELMNMRSHSYVRTLG